MANASCIQHQFGNPALIVLRSLADSAGPAMAALLGHFFNEWLLGRNLVATQQEIVLGVQLLYGEATVRSLIRSAVSEGWLECPPRTPELLRSILYRNTENPPYTESYCRWCKSLCKLLHRHHYPVRRSRGGIETVDICTKCHVEYHWMERRPLYSPTAMTLRAFEDSNVSLDDVFREHATALRKMQREHSHGF